MNECRLDVQAQLVKRDGCTDTEDLQIHQLGRTDGTDETIKSQGFLLGRLCLQAEVNVFT
jgi:hypothetical protein